MDGSKESWALGETAPQWSLNTPVCSPLPKSLAWNISPHPCGRDVKHREGGLPGQDPVDGESDSRVQSAAGCTWGLGARSGCHAQGKHAQEGGGHHNWPAGGRPLWPCQVGFVGGTGEPWKGFKQERGMMKCGFTG